MQTNRRRDIHMVKKQICIVNLEKTYDRPFSELVRIACQFQSRILLHHKDRQVNAKSIMGVMAFELSEGTFLTVTAEGNDETEAVNALESFLTH